MKQLLYVFVSLAVVITVLGHFEWPDDSPNYRGKSFVRPNVIFKSIAGMTGVGKSLYICDLGEKNVKSMSFSGGNQQILVPSTISPGFLGDCDALDLSPDGDTLALASLGTGNVTLYNLVSGTATKVKTGPDTLCTFCGPVPVFFSGLFGINSIAYTPGGLLFTAPFIGLNAFRRVDPNGVLNPIPYLVSNSFGVPDFTSFFNNFKFVTETQLIAPSPNTGKVYRINMDHTTFSAKIVATELSGLTYPVAVEISQDGSIYVADRNGDVYKKPVGGAAVVIAKLSYELDSLWLNEDENRLFVSGNNNDVFRIQLSSNSVTSILSSEVANPNGLAHDGTNLYVANGWDLRVLDSNGDVAKIIPTSDRPAGVLVPLSSTSHVSLNGDRLLVTSSNTGNMAILNKNTFQLLSLLPTGLTGIQGALELPNGNVIVTFPNSGLVFLVNSTGSVVGPIISGVTRPVGITRNKDNVFITGLGGFAPQVFGNPFLPCTGVLASIKLSSLLSFVPGPPLGATVLKSDLCYPEGVVASGVHVAVVETGRKRAVLFDEEGIEVDIIATDLGVNTNISPDAHFTGIAVSGYDFFISGNDVKPRIDLAERKLINGCNPDEFRSFDGTCNNLNVPTYGSGGTFYKRGEEGAEYADGVSELVDRGNPRTISNTFFAGPEGVFNDFDVNLFEVFFGQFINHDLESNVDIADPNDPFLNLFEYAPLDPTDRLWRPTLASLRVTNSSGEIVDGIFEVFNNQTSYLDLSTIYGTDDDMASRLRTHSGGRLLTSDYSFTPQFPPGSPTVNYNDLPPRRTLTLLKILPAVQQMDPAQIFTSGDHRVHENIILSMLHTIWIREHNRIADNLVRNHPLWGDERVFQEARKYTIALYQHIVIDEYLPTVIRKPLDEYHGYRSSVNPGTLAVFAALAFRYGHSTLHAFTIFDKCLEPILIAQGPPIPPSPIPPLDTKLPFLGQIGGVIPPVQMIDFTKGFANLVRSLLLGKAGRTDLIYVDDIRNIDLSFGGINTGGAGIDLGAFDIFRARNNGVPNYHTIRKTYHGKSRSVNNIYRRCPSNEDSIEDHIDCFKRITSNDTLAQELKTFYKKVNNIDGIVGLLAEDREPGKLLPPTLSNIIQFEYETKRNADRLWYENGQFDLSTVQRIKRTTFSSVIKRTIADLPVLPDDIFHTPSNYEDDLKDSTCDDGPLPPCDFVTLFPPNCEVPPTLPACSGTLTPPNCNYICSTPPSPSDNPACKPRCAPPSLLPPNCFFVSS